MASIWNLLLFMIFFHNHMISLTIAAKPTTAEPSTTPTAYPTASPQMPTATPIAMMHYFLSGNVLPFNDSIQFCQDICNSDLASIHSADQLHDAANSINVRPQTIWAPVANERNEAYIGLTSDDFPSAPFSWSDHSPFDYGSDTTLGTEPWKENHPKGYQPTCVILEANTTRWRDVPCDYNSADRFLCNHCNGNINKYAVVTTNETVASYTRSNAICKSIYGTSLASIHTDRDHAEIMNLLRISGHNTAWIGLKSIASNYIWEDGTSFNYGAKFTTCSPYCASDSCVVMNDQNQTWQHKSCTNSYVYICNLPSELSFDLNTWTSLDAYSNWSYDPHTMEVSHPMVPDPSIYAEFMILDKQWFNGNDPLRIELGFVIDEYDVGDLWFNEEWYGVMIYNGATASDCDAYWFVLGIYSSYYAVEIWENLGGIHDDELIAEGAHIPLQIPISGTLSIRVTNGNFFEVWLNNEQHISYVHRTPNFNVLTNGYSGYIALYSGEYVKTRTKYLYISGTPETVSPLQVYLPESLCLKLTAPVNSVMPTVSPTDIPVANVPTGSPSDKSIAPTENPIDIITGNPSSSTIDTVDPTQNPVDLSTTVDPTQNPVDSSITTIDTVIPTQNPVDLSITTINTVDPTQNPVDLSITTITTVIPTQNPVVLSTNDPSHSGLTSTVFPTANPIEDDADAVSSTNTFDIDNTMSNIVVIKYEYDMVPVIVVIICCTIVIICVVVGVFVFKKHDVRHDAKRNEAYLKEENVKEMDGDEKQKEGLQIEAEDSQSAEGKNRDLTTSVFHDKNKSGDAEDKHANVEITEVTRDAMKNDKMVLGIVTTAEGPSAAPQSVKDNDDQNIEGEDDDDDDSLDSEDLYINEAAQTTAGPPSVEK